MKPEELAHPELAAVEIAAGGGGELSRGEAIVKGALAVGAIYGTLLVGPYVRRALAATKGGDLGILNLAFVLENMQASFYAEARSKAKAKGELKRLIDLIAPEEKQHVEAVEAQIKQLGGKPEPKPKFSFPYEDPTSFLFLAQGFEDVGIAFYNGTSPELRSMEALATIGSILGVEARHSAAIRIQNHAKPAPDPFDPTLDEEGMLRAIEPYRVG